MSAPAARPPLDAADLVGALRGTPWRLRVVESSPSTNTDLLAAAAAGEPEGAVLVAERQTAGRGRLDRSWVSPAGAGLTFSLLLRPTRPPAEWPLLPLLAGLALAAAARASGAAVGLKWPNDLLDRDGRKLAGILAESSRSAVVVGIGLNVTTRPEELPHDGASSLALAGAPILDRSRLLVAILRELDTRYRAWQRGDGPAELIRAYRGQCVTLGAEVAVQLPQERVVTGVARCVDDDGRLVVRTADGATCVVGAGDVVHVRAAR